MKISNVSPKTFIVLYWLSLSLYIFSLAFEYSSFQLITTVLLIPFLALATNSKKEVVNGYFYILFMAWIGDILLLSENPSTTFSAVISYWGNLLAISALLQRKLVGSILSQIQEKEGVFALLVLGIAILSIVVIIEPYAGIIIIPIVFYGITLILTGILSFIIYSRNKTIRNRNLILGYVFMCISALTKAIEIIYFDNNYYFFWNPLFYALGHYYFYLYFTHKSKHNHAI
ncbi:lysoplasmalogenase family protein [Flavobacteriaceae bacterium]|nr:lysoplasmalogenase family protein [Flavobacteriaceae bacterium]